MIRVQKTPDVPAVLLRDGVAKTASDCSLYESCPDDYSEGRKKFGALARIYGHSTVKTQLIVEQHGKCCFCEADFTANGYGDVEHFRPKAAYQTAPGSSLLPPGYYWLAYDWQNLYFSCQICNQRHKKNFFPLEEETARARNHMHDLNREKPLLIHPGIDNPDDHLQFNRHVITHRTAKGQHSIVGYGLDRPELNAVREAHLQNVANNVALASVDLDALSDLDKQEFSALLKLPWPVIEPLIRTAKEFVAVAASNRKAFALMVRQNFSQLPV